MPAIKQAGLLASLAAMMGLQGTSAAPRQAPSGRNLIPRLYRGVGARLGLTVRGLRFVYDPAAVVVKPQGLRERRRRVRQIVLGTIPGEQLGGDRMAEYHLAKKNYAPMGVIR